MLMLNAIKAGSPIVLMEFGILTEGIILHVDEEIQSVTYETESGQETILWKPNSRVGGRYFEFAKHSERDTLFAYFKGWSSDKYVRY